MPQQQLKSSLIVGWNIEAMSFYDYLLERPLLNYNIRGFIRPKGDTKKLFYRNVPLLGGLDILVDSIEKYDVEEIIILLSTNEKNYLKDIVHQCKLTNVTYNIISESVGDDYKHFVRNIIKDAIKSEGFGFRRIFDLFVSSIMLILFSPVFLLTVLAIKLDSEGPVFYSQKRYGMNKSVFYVHKFRSMVQDAEKISGPVWASKSDPRVTRVGAFMRKTRIDELPQLINVLVGEMSFIGPRPERPFFSETLKKQIPFYLNRLKTKPGITGLAQVTVGYDETIEDVREKVKQDIEYIDNKSSFFLNTKILFKTFIVVLTGQGQ